MYPSRFHFFPLALPFVLGLFLLVVFLVAFVEVGVLGYAYEKVGVDRRYVFTLLVLSLVGSGVNIPVAELPPERVLSGEEVLFFGMRYVVPVVEDWPRTVIAINVGGAVIPTLLSLYLVVKNGLWAPSLVAVAVVAAIVHALARPVRGVGIAVPGLVPPPHHRVVRRGRVGVRVVDRVVQPAALAAAAGRGDDQLRHGRDVAQLDQVAGQEDVAIVLADLLLQERDARAGAGEAPVAAHDADVVPHEAADLVPVLRDHDRLVAVGGVAGIPGTHVRPAPAILAEARAGVAGGAVREHQRLEERVRGQTVGAVEPRARHLAAGVEALERGRAVQVREHAAAGVVGRGHDRDRLPRHVDAEAAAGLVHGREAAAHELRVTVRDVEVHALEAVHLHLVVDGARDDVARRELGARVVALHEHLAVGPTEHRPLAAQRLGHEEGLRLGVIEAGRVELEELHVGDRRAGAVGHGDAVAGGDVGVGGVEVDLARAARAEEGRARGEALDLARRAVDDVGAPADRARG